MLVYEVCQNWAVNHSDVHIYIASCEDLRKAREMLHFKKNEKSITMEFNKCLAAKQRENQMNESRPSSNITLGICAILLCDSCGTSQVSNAPIENRILGQILISARNTNCNPKSITLR